MSHARFLVGDVFDRMAELDDGSVDLILTSPPFMNLRSYLPADHPQKALEIGSEANPGAFIDTLLELTVEWRRLLAPHGSIAIELGDTYSGSGGAGGDYADDGFRDGQPKFRQTSRDGWPLAKSLCLIPELYRLALVYGVNPLSGRRVEPWRVRNVVRWIRPNPPVGALGDKFRPATSEMVVACVSGKRYFDLDAVREDYGARSLANAGYPTSYRADPAGGYDERERTVAPHPAGAPPLDWWNIPTAPYKGSHYATFPEALCVRPIKAMCPARVCVECGEPSRRITEPTEDYAAVRGVRGFSPEDRRGNDSHLAASQRSNGRGGPTAQHETLGWSDCGHGDNWRPGVVLDPFGGSGTTGAVAVGHGRDAILIDLDPRNVALAEGRIGMFLTVEMPDEARPEADRPDDSLLADGREGAA